ncbi:MAG: DNA-processing protein DprA [Nitrospirota bacterium]
MPDLRYWLALNLLPDIGPVLARRLVSAFGEPENIFNTPLGELRKVDSIGEERARSIADFKDWDVVNKELDKTNEKKVTIVVFTDMTYPESLRHIHDAPILLYVKGGIEENDKYAVAMVGSRSATEYGIRVSEKISYGLASSGLTVVSGMARGIDSASHRGALKAKGRTIAVLGSGIDVIYPPENRGLMEKIATSGAVISEFPMGTKPDKNNFPRRNRIISAMSVGVIVVEAAVDSGSLITVGYALEHGKEVFAVPGNITSAGSKGTNDLIRKGAKLIENAQDVIDELRPQLKGVISEDKFNAKTKKPVPEMTDSEKILYACLDSEPKHIDDIIRKTERSSSEALSILLSLELKGIVKQIDGKRFVIEN